MRPTTPRDQRASRLFAGVVLLLATNTSALAQIPNLRTGEVIPRDVREMYDRGLEYLATTQGEKGDWGSGGGEAGAGTTGLIVMAFLASGEDPNFGPYSNHLRKAIRNIIEQQDASTGFLGQSMYHHGFGMLGLAEAYGAIDERNLWPESQKKDKRSIGQTLELAVRAALTSQKSNPLGAWRYSPNATDADTSVSGAVLVGLLAARNAGIEVPDQAIDRAVAYFKSMTSTNGFVAYSGGMGGFGESLARSSIASLVFSVARRKDLPEFKSTLSHIKERLDQPAQGYPEYGRYYQAQALFQGDLASWEKWNTLTIRTLKQSQQPDGSFRGQWGPAFSTAMSLLAVALNYRFLPIYER